MRIELDALLKGKATLIKGKEYLPTEAYITPFLERMSKYTDDFTVQVKLPDQTTLTKEGDINMEDITFNRVNIEAILPEEYEYEGHKRVVGFVYALDTRKPIVKQYVGAIRSACLNLCVFNPDALSVQELAPETPINYSFLGHCLSMTDNINAMLKLLASKEYTRRQCYNEMGLWIDNCLNDRNSFSSLGGKVKLSDTLPVEVYKNLFYNKKSDYYREDDYVNGFDIYNAFTDIICNGKRADLINRFEKTFLVKNIMDLR
jgi:hypothetical protein